MYLIIADSFKFDDKDRNYFLCSKEHYNNVIKSFPEIQTLEPKEIEGLLLYSIKQDHAERKVMEVECESFVVENSSVKINYGQMAESEITCKTIRRNLYGLLKRKGKLPDGLLTPFIALVDINDFYKLQGIENPKIKGKINEIEDLKKRRHWIDIINYFGNINNIEKSECWDNLPYLNEVVFALAKVVEPGYKKISSVEKLQYEKIFFKTINHFFDSEPNNQAIKSILAYHYYCVFVAEKKNDKGYYDKANKLYLDIIKNSPDNYKEKYRYWKLQQQYFDITKWNLGDKWLAKVNEILGGFQSLILDYPKLSEDKQKRNKKEYIKSLYAYSVFAIENLLQAWDCYVNNLVFNQPIAEYMFSKEKLQMIVDVEKYLCEIVKIRQFANRKIEFIDLQEKPSYLDVLYRQAQIEQVKGIIHTLKQSLKHECDKSFVKSNDYLNQLFKIAYEFKNKSECKVNFLFPHYAKEPKAINDYFLGIHDLDKYFTHAKPYLLYQYAVISFLRNEKEKALQIISTITQNDNCFNKSKLLKEKILNGN